MSASTYQEALGSFALDGLSAQEHLLDVGGGNPMVAQLSGSTGKLSVSALWGSGGRSMVSEKRGDGSGYKPGMCSVS